MLSVCIFQTVQGCFSRFSSYNEMYWPGGMSFGPKFKWSMNSPVINSLLLILYSRYSRWCETTKEKPIVVVTEAMLCKRPLPAFSVGRP